jgi:hypothetical protein
MVSLAACLHWPPLVTLDDMLDRCRALEERAGALYRRYAADPGGSAASRALWTQLAGEEEEHARGVARVARDLAPTRGWQTSVEGWGEALDDVAVRLARAEALAPTATLDRRLAAALDLEGSEIEALRRMVLAASGEPVPAEPTDEHALRLAEEAVALSDDPEVGLRAAMVRARARLARRGAAAS